MYYRKGNRFVYSTPDNAQAGPWTFGLVALIMSTFVVVLRGVVRRKSWAWSDSCLVLSYVRPLPSPSVLTLKLTSDQIIAAGYWGLLFYSLLHGLATSVSLSDEDRIMILAKEYFASQALLSISTGIMRLSLAMVVVEFVKDIRGRMRMAFRVNAGVIGIWTLAAPLVTMVACAPSGPRGIWMCPAETPRRLLSTIIEVLFEVGLVVLPALKFCKLQMPWSKKVKIVLTFSLRFMVAGLRVAHYVAYDRYLRSGTPSIDLAQTLVLEQSLLLLGALTASAPVFLNTLAGFGSTHLLTMNHSRSEGTSSHQLSALGSGVAGQARSDVAKDGSESASRSINGRKENSHTDACSATSVATTFGHEERPSEDSGLAILSRS